MGAQISQYSSPEGGRKGTYGSGVCRSDETVTVGVVMGSERVAEAVREPVVVLEAGGRTHEHLLIEPPVL